MSHKYDMYLFATSLAPFVLFILLMSLLIAEISHKVQFYQWAFYALLLAVLLMEFRVRLGYKTQRGRLFYLHLCVAIPFLISLGILAFYTQPSWLVVICNILLGILSVAGLTLFVRSILSASPKNT